MTRDLNGWVPVGALLLAFACASATAEEKSAWPLEQRSAAGSGAPATAPAQNSAEGMGGMQPGQMGGMQHGPMGSMNAGQAPQSGMGGMPPGATGGPSQGGGMGMGGMQHGGAGGGMMGGGMMGMPAMSEQDKEELLKKALELDLKLGQLRIRIAQAADEAERERLKAEHRAVFKEYLPKLHKLMMQSHMETMKMQGGSSGQPMKH